MQVAIFEYSVTENARQAAPLEQMLVWLPLHVARNPPPTTLELSLLVETTHQIVGNSENRCHDTVEIVMRNIKKASFSP